MAKQHVLTPGGYPDTFADYVTFDSKREVIEYLNQSFGWDSAHVFHGEREPWNEVDPYPDFALERGPRGGWSWNIA